MPPHRERAAPPARLTPPTTPKTCNKRRICDLHPRDRPGQQKESYLDDRNPPNRHLDGELALVSERPTLHRSTRIGPRSLCSSPLGSRTRRGDFRCLSAPPRHNMTPARNSAVFFSFAGLRSPQSSQSGGVAGSSRAWGLAWTSEPESHSTTSASCRTSARARKARRWSAGVSLITTSGLHQREKRYARRILYRPMSSANPEKRNGIDCELLRALD